MRKLLYLFAIVLCLNVFGVRMVGCGPKGTPEEVPMDYDPSTEEDYGDEMGDDEDLDEE